MYQQISKILLTVFVFALISCAAEDPEQRLAQAEAYLGEGKKRAAIIELKNLLSKTPKHLAGRLLLGDVYHTAGDYRGALKEYKRALQVSGNAEEIEDKLFRVQVRAGESKEVVEELGKRDSLPPNLQVRLGEAHLWLNEFDAAAEIFTEALKRDPSLVDAYTGSAQIQWQALNYESARTLLKAAVKRDKENHEPWVLLGEIALAKGEVEEAVVYFKSVIERPSGKIVGQLGLARAALMSQDLEMASQHLQVLEKLAGDQLMVLYMGGLIAFQSGDFQVAETKLRKVLKVDNVNVPALMLLGTIKFRENSTAQASEYLNRAAVQDSTNVDVVKMLSSLRIRQNDLKGALALLSPLALESDDPQLLALYAVLLEKQGDINGAGVVLAKAVNLAPDVASLRTHLAINLLSAGDVSGAASELEAAVDLQQNLFESDKLLIMVKLQQGELVVAEDLANDLLSKSPDSAIAYYLLAQVKLAQQEEGVSKWALQRSFDLNPSFYPAYVDLVRLNKGNLAVLAKLQEQALKHNPQHLEARMQAAKSAFDKADLKSGERHLQRAAIGHADEIRPRLALARFYLSQNNLRDAEDMAQECLQLAAESLEAQLVFAQVRYAQGFGEESRDIVSDIEKNERVVFVDEFRKQLADLQGLVGLEHLSVDHYKRLLENSDYVQRSQVLQRLVRLELRTSRLVDARKHFDQLTKATGPSIARLKIEGDLLLAENNLEQAEKILQSLVNKQDRDATIKLALLWARSGELDAARGQLSVWLGVNRKDIGARLMLADIELKSGKSAAAIGHYEQILQIDEDHLVALNNLAWVYLDTDEKKAATTAQKAFHLFPKNPSVLDTLGWVYVQTGQARQAVEYLQRARRLSGNDPTIVYHLAVAFHEVGKSDEAKKLLHTVLNAGAFSEYENARTLLAQLEA